MAAAALHSPAPHYSTRVASTKKSSSKISPVSKPLKSLLSGFSLAKLSARSLEFEFSFRPCFSQQRAVSGAEISSGSPEVSMNDSSIIQEPVGRAVNENGTLVTKGTSNKTVGVLGGGQLARMLCEAASPLGIKIFTLDPSEDAPSSEIAARHIVGSFRNRESVLEFANRCDVITMEIEHVDLASLEALEARGVDVQPKASTIAVIQDKYAQKAHFRKNGVPVADFLEVSDFESALVAGKQFGYPLMIKSKTMAYDGRGNAVAKSEESLQTAINSLGGFDTGLYVEKWAAFEKELAIIVSRGKNGELRSYPVVETTHKDNICHVVESPASVPLDVAKEASRVAEQAIASLEGAGVFGVELFLMSGGKIILNEVAPRPHNSGHHTIEACVTSQYENHLRAVVGLPLGDTAMKVDSAVMVNILGEEDGDEGFKMAHDFMMRALSIDGASVHWYNKPEMRKQRKMGHVTVVGESKKLVWQKVQAITANQSQNDLSEELPLVGVIMGSDSDLKVMKDASQILTQFNIPHEVSIVSAHRTPRRLVEYASSAQSRGIKVIIAGAGGAAHLPGMVAAETPLPVIGVPVRASTLDGLDSLLSIVQMPRGVPVATVAINNATNAALLAVRMLGLADPTLLEKMREYQKEMESVVLAKAEKLETIGWEKYLEP